MKRRSLISFALATLIPTSILSIKTTETPSTINISAHIEDEYAPYVVDGIIRNEQTGVVKTIHEEVSRGSFAKTLTYTSIQNLTFIVTVTAARAGSLNGHLKVNEKVAKINGDQRIMMWLCEIPAESLAEVR